MRALGVSAYAIANGWLLVTKWRGNLRGTLARESPMTVSGFLPLTPEQMAVDHIVLPDDHQLSPGLR